MIQNRKEGYLKEIVDYIKKNLKKGYTKDSLKWALVKQGYPRLEVERAFKKTEEELSREAPILKPKEEIMNDVQEIQQGNHQMPEKKSLWKKLFG